jgi:Mg2+ and Co2+ transporter CorA
MGKNLGSQHDDNMYLTMGMVMMMVMMAMMAIMAIKYRMVGW